MLIIVGTHYRIHGWSLYSLKNVQDVQNVFNVQKSVLEKKEYSSIKVNTQCLSLESPCWEGKNEWRVSSWEDHPAATEPPAQALEETPGPERSHSLYLSDGVP